MITTILIGLFLALTLAVPVLVLCYTVITGIPPMPTMPWTLRGMLQFFPDPCSGTIYELGSAWGGPALALSRIHPEARIVGVELSPLPWLWACARAAFAGPGFLPAQRYRLIPRTHRWSPDDAILTSNIRNYAVPWLMPG